MYSMGCKFQAVARVLIVVWAVPLKGTTWNAFTLKCSLANSLHSRNYTEHNITQETSDI
jgi:hypothetical protein